MSGIPRQWAGPPGPGPTPAQLAVISDTLTAIPMAAVAHTLDYQLIAANQYCSALLKLPTQEMAGRPVRDFIPPADRPTALETARAVADAYPASARPSSSLRRLIAGDGQEVTCWMHIGLATIGGYRCFVACIDLVNPVLSDAHRWRHRAEHDELTGLRSRGTLLAQVAQWLDAGRVIMLAFLDIDNFKTINDTHGHAAGDHVLTTLARRLEQHAPPGCIVGRLSGDEFVLAQTLATGAGAQEKQRQATGVTGLRAVGRQCVAEPIAWGDHLLVISISMGLTISEPGDNPSTLLSKADRAMYAQKSRIGRSRR